MSVSNENVNTIICNHTIIDTIVNYLHSILTDMQFGPHSFSEIDYNNKVVKIVQTKVFFFLFKFDEVG